jgi:hypothetical protein
MKFYHFWDEIRKILFVGILYYSFYSSLWLLRQKIMLTVVKKILPKGRVMLNFNSNFILRYRFVCLLLSVGYFIYQFTGTNYENFGIQFRYLTIWGLTGAMVSSYLLYRSKLNNLPETYHAFISAIAVLNAMVVFLYWKLYFIDPSLVNYSGSIVWFQEYYLHALGPLLIIFDALFFNKSFSQIKKGALTIVGICLFYVVWTEALTAPFNATPVGSVTKGFPYPFLNNMTFSERLGFYATTTLTGLGFYFLGWLLTKIKSLLLS